MRELLCAVLSTCYKISNGSKADVFFEYAPHVNFFSVYWWRDGWSIEKANDITWLVKCEEITEEKLYSTFFRLQDIAAEMGVQL